MILLKNLTLRRGAKVLLERASALIQPRERVGLVGRNGAGKSSLFRLLDGSLHEDGGEFSLPAHWRIAQVAQELPETDQDATGFVVAGDAALVAAQAELDAAQESGDGERIANAHLALADAGAHDAAARAQSLILGLGFKVHELDRPVRSFSGGWRMRLQLARALMSPSDLLLLDEPTNHLDLDALVWLEAWLRRYEGTLIVISHDREFLDAVTNVTLHIEHGQLARYGGNYSRFEEMRAERIGQQAAAFARQQQRIAHLRQFIDRFKAKATKAKQAQSRVKALERMERIAPVLAEADFGFEFREPASLPNPMLSIRDASFGYPAAPVPDDAAPDGEVGAPTLILRDVSRSVLAGQRIGILGANGQGKSTFVKTIARVLAPIAGRITEGKGLNIGYFAQQELELLRPNESPLAHLARLAREQAGAQQAVPAQPAREQELRNFLGGFNFSGEMVQQPVGSMSGGEKARLVLALIVWQRPNLLLLDEPTNHLDLATREALSVALNEFEGTVLLVSHDRALLRSVCDEFWLVANGGVGAFDGDLDDYQRYLLELSRAARAESKSASDSIAGKPALAGGSGQKPSDSSSKPQPNAAEQRKLDARLRQQRFEQLKPLRGELGRTEAGIARLSAQRGEIEQRLADPAVAQSPGELAEAGRRLKALNEEIATLEERWLELSEQIERHEVGTV